MEILEVEPGRVAVLFGGVPMAMVWCVGPEVTLLGGDLVEVPLFGCRAKAMVEGKADGALIEALVGRGWARVDGALRCPVHA